jgi:hypothetical protein
MILTFIDSPWTVLPSMDFLTSMEVPLQRSNWLGVNSMVLDLSTYITTLVKCTWQFFCNIQLGGILQYPLILYSKLKEASNSTSSFSDPNIYRSWTFGSHNRQDAASQLS